MATQATAAITAANTFTAPVLLNTGGPGRYNISVYGVFVATVTVQRSFDGGTTWLDVTNYSAPTEDQGVEIENALYRVGVKTGNFTSGTVNVRLGA